MINESLQCWIFFFETYALKLGFESKLEKGKEVMKSSSVSESFVKLMNMCLDGLNENDSTKNIQYNPYSEKDSFICIKGHIEDLIQVAKKVALKTRGSRLQSYWTCWSSCSKVKTDTYSNTLELITTTKG